MTSATAALLAVLAALSPATALPSPRSIPSQSVFSQRPNTHSEPNLPLIIWHGLGDAYDSEGIQAVGNLYRSIFPESYVYYVHLGDDGGADRHSSFFGNLTEQVNSVCDDIRNTKELPNATATNAVGFSQGGVFLRGLVERCDAVKVRNLVTFGSPHSGITQFASCADNDWWCKIWSGTLRGNTWGHLAQSTLVPAQYFRDPEDMENFLLHSNFLADVNNERKKKVDIYKNRIASLRKFVMYKFQDEEVLHPPESSWFADSNTTSGLLTKLKERELYKQEWLGLKKLDEKGGIVFRTTPGKHMQIEDGALEDAFRRYFVQNVQDSARRKSATSCEKAASRPSTEQIVFGEGHERATVAPCFQQEDDVDPLGPRPHERSFLRWYADETAQTFN